MEEVQKICYENSIIGLGAEDMILHVESSKKKQFALYFKSYQVTSFNYLHEICCKISENDCPILDPLVIISNDQLWECE